MLSQIVPEIIIIVRLQRYLITFGIAKIKTRKTMYGNRKANRYIPTQYTMK